MPTKPKTNYAAPDDEIAAKDRFQTPDYALDPLLPYLSTFHTVWESACGDGLLVNHLQNAGFDVIATDLAIGINYFATDRSDYDIEITNVPFSRKYQWLRRACERDKPFALLMPSDVLFAGKMCQPLIKQYNLEFLVPNKRINFKTPNKGWDSSAQMHTSWVTRGLNIGQLITFVEIEVKSQCEQQQERTPMKTVIVNSSLSFSAYHQVNVDLSASPNKKYQITSDSLDVGSVWSIDDDGTIIIIQIIEARYLKPMTINNWIFETAQKMRSITPWCYLLIEDEIDYEPMIDGMLMSLQELGIIITNNSGFLGNKSSTGECVARIIERKREPKRILPHREFITTTDGEALLMTLPGIGEKKTQVLLNECGSVAMAFVALTDPTITTSTITSAQKQTIRKALELEDGFMFGIVPIGGDQ